MKQTQMPALQRPALELAAMVFLVTADLWWVWDRPWLLTSGRILAAAVLIASLLRRRDASDDPSPRVTAIRAWTEAAAVTMILGGVVVGWAVVVSGPLDEWKLLPRVLPALAFWLGHRLILATIQQLVLQLFLRPLAREILGPGPWAPLAVAILFGLFHLPSWPFAIATAIAALLWLGLYPRSRRLAPLIASHALLAILASTLPERLFLDLKVGAPALDIAAAQRTLASDERQALLKAVSTPQYAAYRGDQDSDFVEGLYRDLLGRLPSDAEVNDGLQQLQEISRLGLAKRMLLAEELDATTLWHRSIDMEPREAANEHTPMRFPAAAILHDEEEYFLEGFSIAEKRLRWTLAPVARLVYPLRRIEPTSCYALRLEAGTFERQTIGLDLNGERLAEWTLDGIEPQFRNARLDAKQLKPGPNLVEFYLPDARNPQGDPRSLGLAFISLRIYPLKDCG